MRPKLIEFAEVKLRYSSEGSEKASFTRFWQSSNFPFTESACTFSPIVSSCFFCLPLTSSAG